MRDCRDPDGGGLERLERQRAKIEADLEFWGEHYDEFARQYPEQFISVYEGRVVAADSDLSRLWSRLDQLGYKPGETSIEFMTKQPRFILL